MNLISNLSLRDKAAVAVATWFGSGFLKPGPGTWGSIFALPLCVLLFVGTQPGHYTAFFDLGYTYLAGTFVTYLVGLWAIYYATPAIGTQADWQGKARSYDQNQIVIDEVLGMEIACWPTLLIHDVHSYALAFAMALVLFRVFDVSKPWPIRLFDKIETTEAVMLDDVAAGAAAAICLTTVILTLQI